MTPKEKAEELVDNIFYRTYHIKDYDAKQCALIAVQETLDELHQLEEYNYISAQLITSRILYWQEVKTEIEKL